MSRSTFLCEDVILWMREREKKKEMKNECLNGLGGKAIHDKITRAEMVGESIPKPRMKRSGKYHFIQVTVP